MTVYLLNTVIHGHDSKDSYLIYKHVIKRQNAIACAEYATIINDFISNARLID
jgi:hypothetical protein